jgi:hypothetical protein
MTGRGWLNTGASARFLGAGFMPPSLAADSGRIPEPNRRSVRALPWLDVGAEQYVLGGRGNLAVSWFQNTLHPHRLRERSVSALGRVNIVAPASGLG